MMSLRTRQDDKRKRRARPGVGRRRSQAIAAKIGRKKATENEIEGCDEGEIWLQIQTKLEIDYLRRRAEQQLDLAQAATHTAAVAAHVAITEAYLERVVTLEDLRKSHNWASDDAAPEPVPAPPSSLPPLIQGDDQ